jgi:hypothetical protein
MAVASLILSILGFMTSLTIFKDLSLMLSIIAIVLGIIALMKTNSRAMCIIAIILSILGIYMLFSDNNGTEVSSNDENSSISTSNSSNDVKTYGLNEEITIKTSQDEYTLVITGIKEMSERNQFSDKNFDQVFLIDYTYKNISSEDTLYISEMNFKIIDEQGEIGDSYPNSTSKDPQSITSGTTCKAQMVLGVNNKSNTIKLQYFDNMFNSKPDAIFEININN